MNEQNIDREQQEKDVKALRQTLLPLDSRCPMPEQLKGEYILESARRPGLLLSPMLKRGLALAAMLLIVLGSALAFNRLRDNGGGYVFEEKTAAVGEQLDTSTPGENAVIVEKVTLPKDAFATTATEAPTIEGTGTEAADTTADTETAAASATDAATTAGTTKANSVAMGSWEELEAAFLKMKKDRDEREIVYYDGFTMEEGTIPAMTTRGAMATTRRMATLMEAEAIMAPAEAKAAPKTGGSDYGETNTQVIGVDEADIPRTTASFSTMSSRSTTAIRVTCIF